MKRQFLAITPRPVREAPLASPRTALAGTAHHLVSNIGLYGEFSVVGYRLGGGAAG
jgi:hypothetical protein